MRYPNMLPVHIAAFAICLFVVVPLTWWSWDREPPYIRTSGMIMPAAPEECKLPELFPQGDIYPGSCVEVMWDITTKRDCIPNERFNVHRSLITSSGAKIVLPSVEGQYGRPPYKGPDITRHFVIPAITPPGKTVYYSEATFTCNLLQQIWPIVINEPNLTFEVKPLPIPHMVVPQMVPSTKAPP
jgi:hypothetical protein